MFLFRPNDIANPPTYLISGDIAVLLLDIQSIQGFTKIGVPTISIPSADANWLSTQLATPLPPNTTPTTVDTEIDGGAPNTQLFTDLFDGGQDDTTIFDDPPLDGS